MIPAKIGPSEASRELKSYYTQTQKDLLSRGLLRTDGGGPDTPYTDYHLARDFIAIAFYDEYSQGEGLIRSNGEEVGLTKWTGPVRIGIRYGDTVEESVRTLTRSELSRYTSRLAQITGHPITFNNANPNFTVLVMTEDDRKGSIEKFARLVPETTPSTIAMMRNMPREIHCMVVTFSRADRRSELVQAIALIRAEHPPLTLKACVHEEVAQGLGLTNDSPRARPSIFNDDDEFAFLTRHDEELLRILYSPELRPGMSIEDASSTVYRRAGDLRGGAS